MRLKKILSILDDAVCFIKKCGTSQIQQTAYRLVEARLSTKGQYILFIQIIGKSTVIESSPQNIVENDYILEGFSKKDIRTITYFACVQNHKPKYKIIMQEFCETLNKILFKLKRHDNNEIISKTAGQISLDKYLINNLSQEDVCSVSYAAGYENSGIETCLNIIQEKNIRHDK